jgi:hypothetical protein
MRDDQMPAGGTEHSASTAEEFWGLISPLKDLFGFHGKPIYRGQGNAEWKLESSILRNNDHRQIFAEVDSLATFLRYCDDRKVKKLERAEKEGFSSETQL